MRARLRQAWEARPPRERAIIAIVAAILGAILYVWFVQFSQHARAHLYGSVATLRLQAARLERQAADFGRLRAAPAPAASRTDLRTLIQAQAGAAGLSHALVKLDATDADQVVVVFNEVAFADWLDWIDDLNSQYVRLDTCRIEMTTAGMVSVTATLLRARPQ